MVKTIIECLLVIRVNAGPELDLSPAGSLELAPKILVGHFMVELDLRGFDL